MTEDFTKDTGPEFHHDHKKRCSGKLNGKQKCVAIIASVGLLVGGGIISTVIESSTAIEKASIEADASIQRASIQSHAHTTKNININIKGHPPVHRHHENDLFDHVGRGYEDGGLQHQLRDLLGPDAPDVIIQKFQRINDDGNVGTIDREGIITPNNFYDGHDPISPPAGFFDNNVIQPSAYHKGHGKGKKPGITEISDNDESVGSDGVDIDSATNPMDELRGLSDTQKAKALSGVANAFQTGNIDISQLTQYCPQIKKALDGKSQEQIDAYEMAVGAQIAPGNEAQTKTILDNVIKTCNSAGSNSGSGSGDGSGS